MLEAYVFIGRDNLDAAERFLRAIDSDAKKLASMPGMGALREFQSEQLKSVRSWPVSGFENWLIFYRFTSNELQILRVIHGARDIERALSE